MDMDIDMKADSGQPTLLTGLPKFSPVPSPAASTNPRQKRAPLPLEAHGSIATRTSSDDETLLEVDHMILDFLLHQAITTCLENVHSTDTTTVDRVLLQVDEFLALFRSRHGNYTFDSELRFRQLLAQLIALTTQRSFPHASTPPISSLLSLRERNTTRARSWIENADRLPTAKYDLTPFDSDLPLKESVLFDNRRGALKPKTNPAAHAFYGSHESISLLDLLPLFMRVSAAAAETIHDISISRTWMRLAIDWILQACLEQYLIFGASGSDAVDEAFAWGWKRDPSGEDASVNAMFEDSEFQKEVRGWSDLKAEALKLLLVFEEDGDIQGHLMKLAQARPMRKCEESIFSYLRALSESIPEPVLVQLEKGKLEGMSKEATREFLRECGLGEGGLVWV